MKTITIPAQESAESLASAFAAALAAEIGWTADENGNVKKTGSGIYFSFYPDGGSVYLSVSNGLTTPDSGSYTAYNENQEYKLWVLKTAAGSVAVGIEKSDYVPYLSAMIARNTAGEYVGFTHNSSIIYMLYKGDSSAKTPNLGINNNDGISTSILKMPDFWSDGAKFADLYYVMSCPFNSTDRVFVIGGKSYRSVGIDANYMYFVLPEG